MNTTHTQASPLRQLHRRPVVWLAWTAAFLYSSWPLGFMLNPFVSRHALASQLEALHQPFNWVFISMDVLTGLIVSVAGVWQIKLHGKRTPLKWCALGYVVFGLLVALAALTPLNCDPEMSHTCGPLLRNPLLIIHGASSILSVAFLFVSTVGLGVLTLRRELARLGRWAFGATIVAWLVFGLGAALEFAFRVTGNNLLQYYFITVCSISIVLIVGTIEYLHLTGSAPPPLPLEDMATDDTMTTATSRVY